MVTHQKWSGANYVDNMLKMVTGGVSSTAAMGKGVTEEQVCHISTRSTYFLNSILIFLSLQFKN